MIELILRELGLVMSNYRDFIFDLPTRCEKFLGTKDQRCEAAQKYDVTLLLMTAAIGLAPYERLDAGDPSSSHQFSENGFSKMLNVSSKDSLTEKFTTHLFGMLALNDGSLEE